MKIDASRAADLFLDASQRSVEPRAGQIGFTRMHVKTIDETKRQIHFVCSTGEIDRYGEIVDQDALRDAIEPFMRNPIFAAGHVYVSPDGSPTVIGNWVRLWVSETGLEGIAEFDDEDPLAIRYWGLYRKGRMRAVSIGFCALAWEMREVDVPGDTRRQRVRVFTKVELIEISAVAIPANRGAVARAAALSGLAASAAGGDHGDDYNALVKALKPAINDCLKTLLHAGPGGHLCNLLQDFAELLQGGRGFGLDVYREVPIDGTVPDPLMEDKGDDTHEIKNALADVLATVQSPGVKG